MHYRYSAITLKTAIAASVVAALALTNPASAQSQGAPSTPNASTNSSAASSRSPLPSSGAAGISQTSVISTPASPGQPLQQGSTYLRPPKPGRQSVPARPATRQGQAGLGAGISGSLLNNGSDGGGSNGGGSNGGGVSPGITP